MDAEKYHFTYIKAKKFNTTNDKTALEYLLKWSMKDQLQLVTFSFNEPYESHLKREFAKNFFSNPEVNSVICKILPSWSYNREQIQDVEVEVVPCTELSMTFFDRILDPDNHIVRCGGNLHHCMDEIVEDFMISDELRKMIIDENSDNYGLFNENERKQLLFRVFQHLILGGKWCQYEDKVTPYLDMAKILYKDLVQVERNADTKEIQVRSSCMKIRLIGKDKKPILPVEPDHLQNFAYLTIDPVFRHVTLLAHEFGGQF